MKIDIKRTDFSPVSTMGEMFVDGAHECYTLELPVIDGLPGSAIPTGLFHAEITYSPKFGRLMPLLSGIPGRSEIRIHWGNTSEDTDGCILVGTIKGIDFIGHSREAFEKLWVKLIDGVKEGGCTVEVSGQPARPHVDPELSTL